MVLHNKHKLVLFILFFISISTLSQKIEFNESFILFKETKTKLPVLIINDSIIYKGLSPKRIPFKHTTYPGILKDYIALSVKEKTYLVHRGTGPVLEFRNDSIVKVNDTDMFRNQFQAVHFVYNDEIYFFGGYGLFTTKNILTKYIFKNKDWLEVQTHGEKAQECRSNAYSFRKGDDLYVFGGGSKDINNITMTKFSDKKVWRLHLPTMQWDCVGEYDSNLLKMDVNNVIENSGKLYFLGAFFLEFDHNTNKLYRYENLYFFEPLSTYIEDGKIVGVFKGNAKSFFYVGDISEFKAKLKSTNDFIIPIAGYIYYISSATVSLLVLILGLFIFKNQLKNIFYPFKGIVYNQRKQVFIFKRKPIILFDDQDKKILMYLIKHLNQYVSLNELNQLFENSSNSETYSATIKRREHAVNVLLFKVSKITGIDEKELIFVKKNEEDKRIKDVLLLPKLLKVYKK
jgi:hypothetical protein